MDAKKKVEELLQKVGAKLLRQSTHYVYRLPNGKNFVCAKTPSCPRAYANQFRQLRDLLGRKKKGFREGERRERKASKRMVVNESKLEPIKGSAGLSMKEQLMHHVKFEDFVQYISETDVRTALQEKRHGALKT